MRRLARYAINALTALSLLLCVVTVTLWVRSFRVSDALSNTRAARSSSFGTSNGRFALLLLQFPETAYQPKEGWKVTRTSPASDIGLGLSDRPDVYRQFG